MTEGQKELFQTVCFLALMQHGEGLVGKQPNYIISKKRTSADLLAAWQMLDDEGQDKVLKWASCWNFPLQVIIEEFSKGELSL